MVVHRDGLDLLALDLVLQHPRGSLLLLILGFVVQQVPEGGEIGLAMLNDLVLNGPSEKVELCSGGVEFSAVSLDYYFLSTGEAVEGSFLERLQVLLVGEVDVEGQFLGGELVLDGVGPAVLGTDELEQSEREFAMLLADRLVLVTGYAEQNLKVRLVAEEVTESLERERLLLVYSWNE